MPTKVFQPNAEEMDMKKKRSDNFEQSLLRWEHNRVIELVAEARNDGWSANKEKLNECQWRICHALMAIVDLAEYMDQTPLEALAGIAKIFAEREKT